MVNHYTLTESAETMMLILPTGPQVKGQIGRSLYIPSVARGFSRVPLVGVIEASLRRLAHYDWNDQIRRF